MANVVLLIIAIFATIVLIAYAFVYQPLLPEGEYAGLIVGISFALFMWGLFIYVELFSGSGE
jgi:hypothetical protein